MWSYQWLGNSVRSMPLVTTQMTTVMTMLEDALNWTRPIVAPCHFARTPACPGVEGGFRNLDRRARQEPGEESSFGTDDRILPRKRLTFIGHSTVTLWRRWSRRLWVCGSALPDVRWISPAQAKGYFRYQIHPRISGLTWLDLLPGATHQPSCYPRPGGQVISQLRQFHGECSPGWTFLRSCSWWEVVSPHMRGDKRWVYDFGSSLEVSVYLDPGKR